jgi:hypothetical protein
LKDLKLLEIFQVNDLNPLLIKLTESKSLTRLSLGEATLSAADAKLLARIPNLKTLSLRISTIRDLAFFDELAKAPKLEDLNLSAMMVQNPQVVKKLNQLTHLKRLAINTDDPNFKGLNIPGCKIISLKPIVNPTQKLVQDITSDMFTTKGRAQTEMTKQNAMLRQYLDKFRGYDKTLPTDVMVPENPPLRATAPWFDLIKENPDKNDLW